MYKNRTKIINISWSSKYGRIEMTMPRMTPEQRAELFEEMAKWERSKKTQIDVD